MAGHSQSGREFLTAYCTRTGSSSTLFRLNLVQYFLVLLGMRLIDFSISAVLPFLRFIWNIPAQVSDLCAKVSKVRSKGKGVGTTPASSEADLVTFAISRTTVPDGLSAEDYLRLGKQYKQNGWIGQSQQALERAFQAAKPGSQTGQQAEQYLRTKVPHVKVSLEVEQQNLLGYHAMAKGDLAKAKEVFEGMMQEIPDFEWPYLNLATAYYKDGQLDQAKFLLRKLLSINPEHVEAWDILARIYTAEFDLTEAREAISKAEELYSEDTHLKALIDCLIALG